MNFGNLTRFIPAALAIFLVVVTLSAALALSKTYREYLTYKREEHKAREELLAKRLEYEVKDERLTLLINDPEFVERVVRQKLGYVRPDETIFRFEGISPER